MTYGFVRTRVLPALIAYGFMPVLAARAALPKVPEGFEVRLVATVPAVTYPCQVATDPDGKLYVAEDPMDQVGPYESSHGRILRFRDGQDPVVFADGFRAIFGMAWYEGSLYVCHMPFLTVLRDTDGDGKADERKDLFKDLGPTRNSGLNDHIVSGLQFGIDGYLYISVGDKGVPQATGPDGRSVQLHGGGTLRCRPDGTGLEVYSTGTRNHLEPNLDERDNLFTYDNTDDGDGWWTRLTHHIDGGYYGYPYDYHDRADRMLPRMAEYGGGSPCGAVIYREDAWPERYRNAGFWAEWGKGKVHAFRFAPNGATFKVAEEIDFALPDEVTNFRPIDLALSYDGKTLYVADWNMGGWGERTEKVGRVFAIAYKGEAPPTRPRGRDRDAIADQVRQLDHPAFNERLRAQRALVRKGREALSAVTRALLDSAIPPLARRHLVWALDGIAGATPEATLPLLEVIQSDHADLRAQAARALGERRVPIAVGPLSDLLKDPEPLVRLQAAIALGRIGDASAIPALLPVLADKDEFVTFSVRQALRRIGHWEDSIQGLASSDEQVRVGMLRALESQYDMIAARALAAYAEDAHRPVVERACAVRFLSAVHRKVKPWDGHWWGTRPASGAAPAKVEAWDGTPLVLETVRRALRDREAGLRAVAVTAVREMDDREALPLLRERYAMESDEDLRRDLASAFGKMGDEQALPLLIASLRSATEPEPVRNAAFSAIEALGTEVGARAMIDLLGDPKLPKQRVPYVMIALGKFRAKEAIPGLLKRLHDPLPAIRTAAVDALGKIGQAEEVAPRLRPLLADPALSVRRSALKALGALEDREAVPAMIAAVDQKDTRFEASMALTAVPDIRSLQVYLRGLTDKSTDLRAASARALAAIRDRAVPVLDHLAERKEIDPAALPELRKVFSGLQPISAWHILGPFLPDARPPVPPAGPVDLNATVPALEGKPTTWKLAREQDEKGRIDLAEVLATNDRLCAFGYAEVQSPAARKAQMSVGSDDTLTVWVNGKPVYEYKDDRGFGHDQANLEVDLIEGANRILVRCGNHGGAWMFAVALTSAVDYAFLKGPSVDFDPEAFRAFALKGQGNARRGQALFADVKGLACIKCHAVGGQGGAVGPDLTGVGAKYPREELIASVLFPSAKIFSGYEPVVVATTDGRVLTGVLKSDTPEFLEIEDAEAQRVRIRKSQVEERKVSDVSLMPNGLAGGLSKQDFADVIAYLESLKEKPARASGGR
jgi:putative membrane-bound dehydrogenase-like protein